MATQSLTFGGQTFMYTTPLSVESEERVFRDESLSLRIITNTSTAQRWLADITLAVDNGSNKSAAVMSTHKALHGFTRSFTIPMPQHLGAEAQGSLNVNALAVVTGQESVITTNGTGSVDVGRYIILPGSTKVYQVTQSDTNRLEIFPNLVADVLAGPINTEPNLTCFYAENDNQRIRWENGTLSTISLSLVEALT